MPFGFFNKKKDTPQSSNAKPNSELAKKLQQKEASVWAVNEVGIWLDLVGLGEYKNVFINNSISGQELLELGEEDMNQLQITKLGHRKKFKKLVEALKKNSNITNFLETLSEANDSAETSTPSSTSQQPSVSQNQSSDLSGGSSSNNSGIDLVFKCYHNDDVHLIAIKKDRATFNELKLRIIEEYHCIKPVIKYKDTEGDFINIRKEEDFAICLQNVPVDSAIRLYITTENDAAQLNDETSSQTSGSELSSNNMAQMQVQRHVEQFPSIYGEDEEPEMDDGAVFFDDFVDAVIIITDDKIIQYVNKSVEKTFGYTRKELIGRNVKILMSNPHRAQHDNYVDNYLRTGQAKIIGTGRMVEARAKDGLIFPIWLSVAESSWLGRHAFTGTIQDLRKDKSKQTNSSVTNLLENLVDAVIIIDTKCNVCFMNKSAEKMFSYNRDELIGKNINKLMPEKYATGHDAYVSHYLETGEKKIIGRGRKVTAKDKLGNQFPIWLSVSETKWNGERGFVGTIQDLRKDNSIEKILN
ncbi:hypothetical protein FDP41_012938 [Naegleria fowleri]|uniref:PAS domain-containing protein n=1 Tax=Naegleria fowleri TaxID=5763 RepID=A0A6A5C5M3_NAEFO|nr:uncharacterized protein FDP41_012938 [Naegleria fowleri]KAF0981150.1 hypothetical protein FDP41_012938 [Naegleria fowleri]CAG4717135.1 unnamed protein product [Naegleria fowleri]